MKTFRLIPMTDFVFNQRDFWKGNEFEFEELGRDCLKYAKFLKQPLKLEMFVPCDDEGNVLEEPKEENYNLGDIHSGFFRQKSDKYQKAKEKVLFEGFEPHEGLFDIKKGSMLYRTFDKKIESLIDKFIEINLTKNGIKMLNL